MTDTPAFTYRSARSRGVLAGISTAIVVETVALHALLVTRHPLIAWLLTSSSVSVLAWRVADWR